MRFLNIFKNIKMFEVFDIFIRNHLIAVLIGEYIGLTILYSTFTEWKNGNIVLSLSIPRSLDQLHLRLQYMKIVSIRTFKNILLSVICISGIIIIWIFILAFLLIGMILIFIIIVTIYSLIIK